MLDVSLCVFGGTCDAGTTFENVDGIGAGVAAGVATAAAADCAVAVVAAAAVAPAPAPVPGAVELAAAVRVRVAADDAASMCVVTRTDNSKISSMRSFDMIVLPNCRHMSGKHSMCCFSN